MVRFERARLRRSSEVIAEGVQFTDGTFVVHWLGEYASTVVWRNATEAMVVYGHDGDTVLEWVVEHV